MKEFKQTVESVRFLPVDTGASVLTYSTTDFNLKRQYTVPAGDGAFFVGSLVSCVRFATQLEGHVKGRIMTGMPYCDASDCELQQVRTELSEFTIGEFESQRYINGTHMLRQLRGRRVLSHEVYYAAYRVRPQATAELADVDWVAEATLSERLNVQYLYRWLLFVGVPSDAGVSEFVRDLVSSGQHWSGGIGDSCEALLRSLCSQSLETVKTACAASTSLSDRAVSCLPAEVSSDMRDLLATAHIT